MTENVEYIHDINQQMAKEMSPTFCMAKWHQTTIYLHRGETHSCYHPPVHDIDFEELIDNPSALHNTRQKKSEREQMLRGEHA